MMIQPIVEGHGEVEAVPILLRRLVACANLQGIVKINSSIRKQRNKLVDKSKLNEVIGSARRQKSDAILIMFDGDDNCPATLGPRVQLWAQEAAGDIPCQVVIPHQEYEAWFLASIVSLQGMRGIKQSVKLHPNPEGVRGVKKQIRERMERGWSYNETIHQPSFSARFSMVAAYRQCRSFRKMMTAFGALLHATGHGIHPWPPPPKQMAQF